MPRKSKQVPEGSFYRDLGLDLRAARVAAGRSQVETAEHLDVTFQQLQKYEKGKDRIPVHRLIRLAAFLEVPLQQLIAPSDSDSEFRSLYSKFSGPEFHTLMEAWGRVKDRAARAALLGLVVCMANSRR
jgi:transcriptional regulator with XRE-family HTH domain